MLQSGGSAFLSNHQADLREKLSGSAWQIACCIDILSKPSVGEQVQRRGEQIPAQRSKHTVLQTALVVTSELPEQVCTACNGFWKTNPMAGSFALSAEGRYNCMEI